MVKSDDQIYNRNSVINAKKQCIEAVESKETDLIATLNGNNPLGSIDNIEKINRDLEILRLALKNIDTVRFKIEMNE
jgi:hypothetical protein